MSGRRDLLRPALRDISGALRDLPLSDWDRIVPQARRAGLLARLGAQLANQDLLDTVPPEPRCHLEAARILAEKHAQDVRRELAYIKQALAPTGVPIVLLKGAAYLMADLPAAQGRMFNDIDILVPEETISRVEAALRREAWNNVDTDAYDERYYRRWMHQIPPLKNVLRDTFVDVHHTIVARTRRLALNPEKLFAAAVPAASDPTLKVPAPTDLVLHSASHLLNEGEFEHGLRDLDDMNILLRHFGGDPGFLPALLDRAEELDLRRPLFYALRYTARLLGTPIPDSVHRADRLKPPNAALRTLMDVLFDQALRPDHPSCRDPLSGIALWLLYVRSHYLLMPPHILVPHLIRKAYVRRFRDEQAAG